MHGKVRLNSLQNNKTSRLVHIKSISYVKYLAMIMDFVSERKENTMEKGENAGYQHFLFFH